MINRLHQLGVLVTRSLGLEEDLPETPGIYLWYIVAVVSICRKPGGPGGSAFLSRRKSWVCFVFWHRKYGPIRGGTLDISEEDANKMFNDAAWRNVVLLWPVDVFFCWKTALMIGKIGNMLLFLLADSCGCRCSNLHLQCRQPWLVVVSSGFIAYHLGIYTQTNHCKPSGLSIFIPKVWKTITNSALFHGFSWWIWFFIAPGRRPSQKETHFPAPVFQVLW